MEEVRGGLPFLDDFVGGLDSYTSSTFSPLARVPVQGYLSNGQINGYQEPCTGAYGRPKHPAQSAPQVSLEYGCNANSGVSLPFKNSFRSENDVLGGCLDQEGMRPSTLQSVESSMSTFEYPNTPSKLFTEPARLQEESPFNITSLDYLDDREADLSAAEPFTRLKVATAPAEVLFATSAELSGQNSFSELSTSGVPRSSGTASLHPGDRASASGTPAQNCGRDQAAAAGAPEALDPDAPVGLAEVRGGSLPATSRAFLVRNSSLSSGQYGMSSAQAAGEEWNGSETARSIEKLGINPRKTEQNRRAQARFRQRKKDMFVDQKRQIQNLTLRLEQAMKERRSYEERSSQLQQLVDAKEKRIETLQLNSKDVKSVDEMCNACWEFVLELRKGRRSLAHTRENIAEMINAMLLWGSPAIGFIRTELVEQLSELLNQSREQANLPSQIWMTDLINAYERMTQRCGECHPQALRMFLGLQLQQTGHTADPAFWQKVLDSGGLNPGQMAQLASARHSLVNKMQQHVVRRAEIARLVQNGGQASAENQQPLLGNMAQSQVVLDLHMQILKEERTAVFNFLAIVRLVLEPVQQAKLMVAAHPFALDLLAICSIVAENSSSFSVLSNSLALLSQLPQDSPFQALTPNKAP